MKIEVTFDNQIDDQADPVELSIHDLTLTGWENLSYTPSEVRDGHIAIYDFEAETEEDEVGFWEALDSCAWLYSSSVRIEHELPEPA